MTDPLTVADLPEPQRSVVRTFRSWPRFRRLFRDRNEVLLRAMPQYDNAVLVAGCQRSGTTALSRLIAGSADFRRYAFTKDDELDAALVLAGLIDLPMGSRYCFQTTYVNENFAEYATLGPGQRLIWILREPGSVVYSMVYNWSRFALDELFLSCGETPGEREARARASRLPWPLGLSRIDRAASAYAGKAAQIEQVSRLVAPEQLLIIDYADLVGSTERVLQRVFQFIDAPYDPSYAERISRPRSECASARRSMKVERAVSGRPALVYERARSHLCQRV